MNKFFLPFCIAIIKTILSLLYLLYVLIKDSVGFSSFVRAIKAFAHSFVDLKLKIILYEIDM